VTRKANRIVPVQQVESLIYLLRGQKVMLDSDLAALYGVEARTLNQAVKRNGERFPSDFMFRLSEEETTLIRTQTFITTADMNSSQIVMSSKKHRGFTYRPYAFTEQGIAMLSSVLRSPRAVQVNIEIMRAFVKIRQWLASNAELSRRLEALERKHDAQFKVVFDAIRKLMDAPVPQQKPEIGFYTARQKAQNKNRMATGSA
jgi:hypothetical protein